MSYFGISIKKILYYKWNVLFNMVSIFLMTVTYIFLWKYIYRDEGEKQQYMIMYAILANLISLLYSNRCSDCIAEKVYKGTFAVDLLRPIHFLKLNFIETAGEITAGFIVKGIPVMLIFFTIYRYLLQKISPVYTLLGILAIVLAVLFYMMLYTILGLLSFWFYEIWPFNRLMNDTIRLLSGRVVPIALFPAWLSAPINRMPFRYLYSFPIELILRGSQCEDISGDFAGLILWNLIVAVIMLLTYKKALHRCVVQGG